MCNCFIEDTLLCSTGDTIKLKIRFLPLGSLQSNRGQHTYTQIDELGLINVSTEIDDVYLTIALHVLGWFYASSQS